MNICEIIQELFHDVMANAGFTAVCELKDNTILMQTGMDSLGFAILVARLEQELGYDPFVLLDTPVYPKTFKEFVNIYEQYQDRRVH